MYCILYVPLNPHLIHEIEIKMQKQQCQVAGRSKDILLAFTFALKFFKALFLIKIRSFFGGLFYALHNRFSKGRMVGHMQCKFE